MERKEQRLRPDEKCRSEMMVTGLEFMGRIVWTVDSEEAGEAEPLNHFTVLSWHGAFASERERRHLNTENWLLFVWVLLFFCGSVNGGKPFSIEQDFWFELKTICTLSTLPGLTFLCTLRFLSHGKFLTFS